MSCQCPFCERVFRCTFCNAITHMLNPADDLDIAMERCCWKCGIRMCARCGQLHQCETFFAVQSCILCLFLEQNGYSAEAQAQWHTRIDTMKTLSAMQELSIK